MLKRDLILDEIQKLARVLARVLGLKEEGKNAEAMFLLEEELKNNFHRGAAELILTPKDELMKEFAPDGTRAESANALGELLYYYAELRWDEHDTQKALAAYERALLLWEHSEKFLKTISFDRAQKRSRIRERIVS